MLKMLHPKFPAGFKLLNDQRPAQRNYKSKQSISSVEAMLPEKSFIRTHRSFIVSFDKIKSFTSELIEISATEIHVGKLYRNGMMRVLG